MREIIMELCMCVCTVLVYVSYIPQLVKLVKTHKAEDISVASWVLYVVGSLSDLTYGLLLWRWEYIFASVSEFMLNLLVLGLTVKYRKEYAKKNIK